MEILNELLLMLKVDQTQVYSHKIRLGVARRLDQKECDKRLGMKTWFDCDGFTCDTLLFFFSSYIYRHKKLAHF